MTSGDAFAQQVLDRLIEAIGDPSDMLTIFEELGEAKGQPLSSYDTLRAGVLMGRAELFMRVAFGGDMREQLPPEAQAGLPHLHDLVDRLVSGQPLRTADSAGFAAVRDAQLAAGPARAEIERHLNSLSQGGLEQLAAALAQGGRLKAVVQVPAGQGPAAPRPPRQVPITLNSRVYVRLTEQGHQYLRDEHTNYWQAVKAQGTVPPNYTPPSYVERSADERGRCSFPLWEFAEKFAPLMGVGIDVSPYFVDDIRLEIEVGSPAPAADMGIPMSGTHYRKKPVVVEARQFGGTDRPHDAEVASWAGAEYQDNGDGRPGVLRIRTLEGVMEAQAGDYIIKGVQGEFYPCRKDIFEVTYERA